MKLYIKSLKLMKQFNSKNEKHYILAKSYLMLGLIWGMERIISPPTPHENRAAI